MTAALVEQLSAAVSGEVRADEPLAGYTTLKVGGPAQALVRAESVDDLLAVAEISRRSGVPWLIVGRGSNLLVADRGWPGVAVALGRAFRGAERAGSDGGSLGAAVEVLAGGAEPMPILANTVAGWHLGGLAFGVAIPGSVGGAVRMNAGAHGSQMRDVLVEAEVIRLTTGVPECIPAVDLDMSYRQTTLPSDAVVVRARLRLHRASHATLTGDMSEMRQWRRDHQPINEPSCGSVFRNPPGDSAGRLIEAAGMKGHRVGAAEVSRVHANFITVGPGARAADVYAVIHEVTDAVERQSGVRLQTEVVTVGFSSDHPTHVGGVS
ncbi:MAG: UDP-N-acetylmuramate dehydrogenase [Nitriliruptorales bacterium]|nr:UDP-N-acetylmuramate dehydrogenase [Nitriliruptorales bacterium]